jgi:hypothetical protein
VLGVYTISDDFRRILKLRFKTLNAFKETVFLTSLVAEHTVYCLTRRRRINTIILC